MGEQRNTDGRFTPEHTDDEILAAVRAHEPAATSEVAGEVGMTRQGADRRLRQLRDDGRVNSKKIAASLVWFSADDTGGRETDETPSMPQADESPSGRSADTPSDVTRGESTDDDILPAAVDREVHDAVESVVSFDDDSRRENRIQAAVTVLQHALDTGEAVGKSHPVVDAVREAFPVEGQNAETYWRKNIRPVLKHYGDYSKATHGYAVEDLDT